MKDRTGRRSIVRALACALLFALVLPLVLSGGALASAPAAATPKTWTISGDSHYLGLQRTSSTDGHNQIMLPRNYGAGQVLGASVDLSSQLPPIGDQGQQGSCTAWATSYYYKTWMEKKEHTGWNISNSYYEYSPSFVYNQINGGQDDGSSYDDAFNVLQTEGDVDIAEMPYSQSDYKTQPTAAQLEAAKPYRIPNNWDYFFVQYGNWPYSPPNDISALKTWLSNGNVLVIGLPIFFDFPDDYGNPTKTYYDYNETSGAAGGHAVCIAGYNDNINPGGADADHKGGFLMVNSWGPTWNGNGRVYLSYDFVKRFCYEAWSMSDLSPDDATISGAAPNTGVAGDTITISGANFGTKRRSAKVTFNGITAATTSWVDGQVKATVPAGSTTGQILVYDWDGKASNGVPFTGGAPPPPPSVTSITPNNGLNNASVSVTIGGSDFSTGCHAKLTSAYGTINATSENRVSSSQFNCTFDLTGSHTGTWDVVVTNSDTQTGTLAGGFTVNQAPIPPPPPTVSTISPTRGYNDSVVSATVGGADFSSGCDVKLTSASGTIIPKSENRVSSSRIDCTFDLHGGEPGDWDVVVTNGDAQTGTLAGGFAVDAALPAPVVNSISPGDGYNNGTVDVYISGANFVTGCHAKLAMGTTVIDAVSESMLSSSLLACSFNINGAQTGGWDVIVGNLDGKTGKLPGGFVVSAEPAPEPPAPTPEPTPVQGKGSTWYLAEGSTAYGFDTLVNIENPNSNAVTAMVTYMTPGGPRTRSAIVLPALSMTVINPRDDIGVSDFSTVVECKEGEPIAVDRRMTWTGPGARSQEGHSSIGVTAPADTWYLAEGSSSWGFECWLLVQNPNSQVANVALTYMIEGEGPRTVYHQVPAASRASFNMETDIGRKDASVKVTSDVPVIPERAMYRNNRREGHDSVGTTSPSNDYYLAEGSSDWGFTTYVLVQNPGDRATNVDITFMTSKGPVAMPTFSMQPDSRRTIKVNDILPGADFSTKVHGSSPIIAERAMYWTTATGEACHDSIGMDSPHSVFYLPDGQTSAGHETWTLVQNPNDVPVQVSIAYLTPSGPGPVIVDKIAANSRKSYDMAQQVPNGLASVVVTSADASRKIMVERSMYWNSRGAGTDSIGGYGD